MKPKYTTAGLKFERVRDMWRSFPSYRVEIPTGGVVEIAVTGADHVHFDGSSNSIGDDSPRRRWMMYRGAEHAASFDYNLKDGEWSSDQYKHVKRLDVYRDATANAVKELDGIGLEAVREFHRQHPEAFREAERLRLTEEIERTEGKLKEAEQTVTTLRGTLDTLREQLQRLEE